MAAVPSCQQMAPELSSCVLFITDKSPAPSEDCCHGVKDIAAKVKTQADRQAVCECIKSLLYKMHNYNSSHIAELPGKCRVNIKVPPINQNTDCSKDVFGAVVCWVEKRSDCGLLYPQ
ncbi:hypothetical protein Ancab_036793 [Ancistrocladus abbreviatus]